MTGLDRHSRDFLSRRDQRELDAYPVRTDGPFPWTPSRFDALIIWGHGLRYTEEILAFLRQQPSLRLLRIESRQIADMRDFISQVYACDPVPLAHLQAKLKYLFDVPSEILFVLVENQSPQESYFGEGPFRHIQCKSLKAIKEEIRNRYNPRLNGMRSEHHVVHATDYEAQTDHLLRVLQFDGGLTFFEKHRGRFPFFVPYFLRSPQFYVVRQLPIAGLRADILTAQPTGGPRGEARFVEATPHFRALCGDTQEYEDYLRAYGQRYLLDDHSLEKLLALRQIPVAALKAMGPILVTRAPTHWRILDGAHRSAAFLHKGIDTVRAVEFVYDV